ncbi:hypothetical protein EON81_11355 [bacterium]|nr:MAG: hypothetical protein EON81_11355 [bacterium]
MVGLLLSGLTAFPLPQEVALLVQWMKLPEGASPGDYSGLTGWILQVHDALQITDERYPFLFYSTDWLAFAHIVITLLFIGPLRDPVRNIWVIEWGMIACVLVLPLALICGPLRDIPMAWRIIDCSFGVVGIVPLYICRRLIKRLESETARTSRAGEGVAVSVVHGQA